MSTIKIYKYPVFGEGQLNKITGNIVRLLDIQLQGVSMMCWAETRDDAPEVTRRLVGIGTGWATPSELYEEMKYFKTVQDACGFVWHFFEIPEGFLFEDN